MESACKALTATETGEDAPEKMSRKYENESCKLSTTIGSEADAPGQAPKEKSPGGGSKSTVEEGTEFLGQCGAPLWDLAGCFCAHGVPSAFGMGQTWRNLHVSPLPHFETFQRIQMPLPLCLRTQVSFQSFRRSSFRTGGGLPGFFGVALGSTFFGVTGA